MVKLTNRRNKNVAAVALANKNARIAWAILSRGEDYRPMTEHADHTEHAAWRDRVGMGGSPVLPTGANETCA